MRATRRRPGSPAWLAIGILFLLPAMAEAQLFPNRPIKRERVPCAAEPPFYAQVRHDYYGYFPTCWSRFPEGWGCPAPNPELPNPTLAFQKRPREVLPESGDSNLAPGPDDGVMPGDPPAGPDRNLPDLPNAGGRAPFDLDRPETPAAPPAGDIPSTTPRAPDINTTPRPGNPAPRPGNPAPSTAPGRVAPPTTGLMPMPELPSASASASAVPTMEPGSMMMVPEATLASNPSPARGDLGQLPPPSGAFPVVAAEPVPVLGVPAQAPRRRGVLGGLFGSGNRRNR